MEQGRKLVILTRGDSLAEPRMEIGDVQQLAHRLGCYRPDEVLAVYAPDEDVLVKVDWKTELGEFKTNGIAIGKVRVYLPDGDEQAAHYVVQRP